MMNHEQDELLSNKLIQAGLISPEKIKEIVLSAKEKNKNFEELLIDKKIIDIEKLTEFKAQISNLSYQSLVSKKINEQILNIIPVEVADNYKIVCFDKINSKISIGIVDPDNFKAFEAVDFLAKEFGLEVEYYLISSTSFTHAFKQYRTLSKEISVALKLKADEELKTNKRQDEEEVEFEEVIGSAPVIKIVSVIIRHAVEGGASDIHIEPLQRESRVRYRIDGILKTSLVLPKNVHNAIVARIKVMANLKLDETRIPQDGRIRQILNGKEIDFRVSTLPLIGEEKVVMRVLDIGKGAPTLEELGFSKMAIAIVKENIKKTNKLFLVVGPTGSGKSTTLYSVLNLLNKEGVNISTLEDPVEYFIPGVNQSQIKPEVGFTFAAGLRSLLRQDPNIIMVGEVRDNETAELAIHASLTGHFVLSTMHTNNAFGAIPRLVDMEVEPFLLGSTLSTVVAQRLARKNCSNCLIEEKIPDEIVEELKAEIAAIPIEIIKDAMDNFDINNLKIFKGKGCPRCGGSGYSGRVAITEVIDINDELREKIIDQEKSIKLEDVKNSQTFVSMKQDGIIKTLKGLTTMEEVLRVMRD